MRKPLVGVDTGGTFTDLVLVEDGQVRTWKLPSTPDDPSRAVLEGLRHLVDERPADMFHGSTVATNALLEQKGAEVALVVTAGFMDLLAIGRQNRAELYALHPRQDRPLVGQERVVEVDERILFDGQVETSLSDGEVSRVVEAVLASGCRSVAICLLHAYANGRHEERITQALEAVGLQVSASHRVLAEFREYERASTTVVNATVSPVMSRYLARVEQGIQSSLRIMQSNGGAISARVAGQQAVRTILSGPAGGLVGAFACGRRAGHDRLMTFDMGGTSTDVALCAGELGTTQETVIGGWPIKVPMIDIHTVGAGGGSIARIDAAGALRVGPESAGADPGPVCYGRGGTAVTVTDANLYLGRLLHDRFLGGRMALDVATSTRAVEALAAEAGLEPLRLAEGVLEVAEEVMAGALRVVSVQRGFDPREFTLLPFGGAGGLHACALAEKLGIPRILLPAHPGLLSAVGMVLADIIRDYARSVLWDAGVDPQVLESTYADMEQEAVAEMAAEDFAANALQLQRAVDVRYLGQSFEVTVPYTVDFLGAFHQRHAQLYGYQDPQRPVEIVTLRLRAVGPRPHVDLTVAPQSDTRLGDETRPVVIGGAQIDCPLYVRTRLTPEVSLAGPALVVEETATHLVRPDWQLQVDTCGNLVLERTPEVSS